MSPEDIVQSFLIKKDILRVVRSTGPRDWFTPSLQCKRLYLLAPEAVNSHETNLV